MTVTERNTSILRRVLHRVGIWFCAHPFELLHRTDGRVTLVCQRCGRVTHGWLAEDRISARRQMPVQK
jgi:hypothetical protein